jgi:O-acetyl-ADP-ribose deacetylase (regulator of RNase III)
MNANKNLLGGGGVARPLATTIGHFRQACAAFVIKYSAL